METGRAKEGVNLFLYFFSPFKRQLTLLLFIMLVSGLLEAVNLAAFYPLIDAGLDLQSDNFIIRFFEVFVSEVTHESRFAATCIVLIVVSTAAFLAKFAYLYAQNKLMVNVIGHMKCNLMNKFMDAEYSYFVKKRQGELIHATTVLPDKIVNLALGATRFLNDAITATLLFFLLLALTWTGTACLLAIGFFYVYIIRNVIYKRIYRCAEVVAKQEQATNIILNEYISGVKPIMVFNVYNAWRQKYETAVKTHMDNLFQVQLLYFVPDTILKFMFYVLLGLIGIVLNGGGSNELLVILPTFGTFVLISSRFLPSIQNAGNALLRVAENVPNGIIIRQICEDAISPLKHREKELSGFDKAIAFEQVQFSYDEGDDPILKSVSFTIEKNRMTAVVGPSGAGKTSIINLVLKLHQTKAGRITIDGVDVFDYSNASYLKLIGYVGQETFIFNASIKDNIRFFDEGCSDQDIVEAAKLANAHEFITETKAGYDTPVGDAGMKLSGGQRQRIAIARAILKKPEIIILDEATSALDSVAEKKVQQAINQLSKNTTLLVIAHRLSTIQQADKIVVLEKGVIREEGTHETLLKQGDLYSSLYQEQSQHDIRQPRSGDSI